MEGKARAPDNLSKAVAMIRRLGGVSILVTLCILSTGAALSADDKAKASLKLSKEEQSILDLTNEARKKEGLPHLEPNSVLTDVARAHSANMAKTGEMSHELDGKTPSDRVKAAGYEYSSVGENIAYSSELMVKQIFEGWMESAPHRMNILKKEYQEIGIGLARNAKGEWYYTQVFGTPKKRANKQP